jgi:hypothetical protein
VVAGQRREGRMGQQTKRAATKPQLHHLVSPVTAPLGELSIYPA